MENKMENKKFWMVLRSGKVNDNYINVPTVKHYTELSAETEAERLCHKHPNNDFYVLESLQTFRGYVAVDRFNHFVSSESINEKKGL